MKTDINQTTPTAADATNWTPEYAGLAHLKTVPRPWQITVRRFDGFAEVQLFDSSMIALMDRWSEQFDTVEEAKAAGEAKARELWPNAELSDGTPKIIKL